MSDVDKIREWFEQLADLPPAERKARLCQSSLSDANQGGLARLLSAHDQSEGFLGGSAFSLLADLDEILPPPCFEIGAIACERFEIQRLAGAGGMGEVYEAYDRELRCKVALKTVLIGSLGDEAAQRRLRREAAMARQITHPNVCRVNDVFRHRQGEGAGALDMTVLAMEFIGGPTLEEFVDSRGALPEADLRWVGERLADALSAAHAMNVIHRDLKPSNVLLELEETLTQPAIRRIVVTDFGLAAGHSGFDRSTRSRNQLLGTPQYMAPELWEGHEPTVQSDIYSLGVMLFELANGKRFPKAAVAGFGEALRPRVQNKPKISIRPEVSRDLRAVILRCLEAQPEARFSTAAELRDALRMPKPWAQLLRPITRRTLLTTAGVAAAVSGGAWLSLAPGRPRRLVILPVQNETGKAELEYICRGITSELIRKATKTDQLRVIPWYGPPPVALHDMQSDYSLQGAMTDAGRGPGLRMWILDPKDGSVIWNRSFDRSRYSDLLQMQADVGNAVGAELEILTKRSSWLGGMRAKLASQNAKGKPITSSPEAFDCYLRGRSLLSERGLRSTLDAITQLERATELDHSFALAFAALAESQTALMDYGYATTPELLVRGTQHAERAVREGPLVAEAHTILGSFRQLGWDWEGSASSYNEAHRLQPLYAKAIQYHAGLKAQFAITEEVLQQTRRALELDPYDPAIRIGLNMYLFFAGQYDEAIAVIADLVRVKNHVYARHNLGNVYAWLGVISSGAAAHRYFEQAFEQAAAVKQAEERPDGSAVAMRASDRMYSLYHALAGNAKKADPYIQKLTIEVNSGKTSPLMLARAQAALGDSDTAMQLLEVAFIRRDRGLLYLKMNPFLRVLHSQPRFQELMRTMRLT